MSTRASIRVGGEREGAGGTRCLSPGRGEFGGELAQQTKSCAPQCCVCAKLHVCKQTAGMELLTFQIKTSDQVYVCLT